MLSGADLAFVARCANAGVIIPNRPFTNPMQPLIPFKRALVLVAAALAASAVLAQEATIYKLTARDGVFEPTTIEVPAGKRFRIEIVNEGKSAI